MIHERLALDAQSVRRYDNNGNLHVAVSHLTKAQVRPYYGSEIIGWQRLKLEPTKVYYGYAPPEELSKPETVESTNGIPIQLDHHPDYADDPQLKTRVGSTGTDGAFREPYLDNSLHITVENAIRRILDGSMRELSLAYSYTPDFTSGKTPDGDPYDFIMRDISANHVALVEQGRAGRDVLVQDSQLKEVGPMDDKEKTTPATDGDPAVEKKEVALARAIGEAAKGIEDLHTQDQEGNVIDKPAEDEPVAEDEDKDAAIRRILDDMVEKGLKPEDARSFLGALKDLAYNPDEAQDGDEDMAEGADDELEQAEQNVLSAKAEAGAKPVGFVERDVIATIPAPTDDATQVYPKGTCPPVAIRGQFYAIATGAATEGQSVLCDPTTGKVTYGTAGATNDTGWTVVFPRGVKTIAEGDTVIYQNFGVDKAA